MDNDEYIIIKTLNSKDEIESEIIGKVLHRDISSGYYTIEIVIAKVHSHPDATSWKGQVVTITDDHFNPNTVIIPITPEEIYSNYFEYLL